MFYEPRTPIFDQPSRASAETRPTAPPPTQFGTLSFGGGRPVVSLSPSAALAAVMITIDRVEQVIDQETQELRNHRATDLREFNNRKSQGLLELSRAMRGLGEAGRDRRLQGRLVQLRAKIENNLSVLSMHLAAAQEVSAIIARAIQDAESDGTYSARLGIEGPPSC
jgi:hypothetical protein